MPFWKKQQKQQPQTPPIDSIQQQLAHLEKLVLELKSKPIEYHFHIQHVDIQKPTLHKLAFHLDQIDIEQLSGALNVGNNFGVNVGDTSASEHDKHISKKTPSVKKTKDGYQINFHVDGGGSSS